MSLYPRLLARLDLLFDTAAAIVLTLAAGWLAIKLTHLLVARVFARLKATNYMDPAQVRRLETLAVLVRSAARYVVDLVVILMILATIIPNAVGPLLASVSVLGLAVGFGAQNLVRDVITGFFIILEDQYGVGDYITAAGLTGYVEEVGLRSTRLRDFGGEVHTIPNGIIDKTTNLSRGPIRSLVDVAVAYEEDLQHVWQVLADATAEFSRDRQAQLSQPVENLGVIAVQPPEMRIRLAAYSRPGEPWWEVERGLRRHVKLALDRAGIAAPVPKQVLFAARPGTEAVLRGDHPV